MARFRQSPVARHQMDSEQLSQRYEGSFVAADDISQ